MVADVLQSVFWKSVILYQHLFVMFWCIFRGENIGKGSGVWCLMLSIQCVAQLVDAHAAVVADQFPIFRRSVNSLTDSRNV